MPSTQQLDPFLLQVVACPACDSRPPLTPGTADDLQTLDCARCGRKYPIEDGIPVLLVERAMLPARDGA